MKVKIGKMALKIFLPLVFLATAGVVVSMFIIFAEDPGKMEQARILPQVRVLQVKSQPLSLSVKSQGTAQARTSTMLTAEVSGVVEFVSPLVFPGNFFKKGDLLLTIDPTEYEAALANARGQLVNAQLAYAQEKALAEQAKLDWEGIGKGPATDLVLRIPQLNKAAADLETAQATLKLAERNLAKTSLRAPYDGSVREKYVDVGQMVSSRNTQLARIFSIDVVEVRLPISANHAQFITTPESYWNGPDMPAKPKVALSSFIGDRQWTWEGVIDRTEGVIDPTTRQIFLVAVVRDPYARLAGSSRPPLKVGQFVEAAIEGKDLGKGFIIPREALKPGDKVYVISPDHKLKITPVSVTYVDVETAYIRGGLEDGDRICLSPLNIVVDGMEVRIEEETRQL